MIEQFFRLSVIWYWIITVVSILVLLGFSLYILSQYHFGKALAPFFWGRLRSWSDKNLVIFAVCTLDNNVFLEYGTKNQGGTYRIGEAPKKLTWFERNVLKLKPAGLEECIIPQSTYTINGVTTIPVLDLHPRLHNDILEGINQLVSIEIKTLDDFSNEVIKTPDKTLFPGYTYLSFYDMFIATFQKYHLNVTVSDILNFTGKNLDENYRETMDSKNFNIKAKTNKENDYSKYGWFSILIMVIGLVIKLIYVTVWK